MEVMFFANGNTAVFAKGKQVGHLQKSWFLFYVDFLVKRGIDPTEVDFTMPDGTRTEVVNVEKGYTWREK